MVGGCGNAGGGALTSTTDDPPPSTSVSGGGGEAVVSGEEETGAGEDPPVGIAMAEISGSATASTASFPWNQSLVMSATLVERMAPAAEFACDASAKMSSLLTTTDPAAALSTTLRAEGKAERRDSRKAAESNAASSPATVNVAVTTARYVDPGGAGGAITNADAWVGPVDEPPPPPVARTRAATAPAARTEPQSRSARRREGRHGCVRCVKASLDPLRSISPPRSAALSSPPACPSPPSCCLWLRGLSPEGTTRARGAGQAGAGRVREAAALTDDGGWPAGEDPFCPLPTDPPPWRLACRAAPRRRCRLLISRSLDGAAERGGREAMHSCSSSSSAYSRGTAEELRWPTRVGDSTALSAARAAAGDAGAGSPVESSQRGSAS